MILERYLLQLGHVMLLWVGIVYSLCVVHATTHPTAYFRIGPGAGVRFLGFEVDTWSKWVHVVVVVIIS